MSRRGRELIDADQEAGWQPHRGQGGERSERLPEIEVVTRDGAQAQPPRRRSPWSLLAWFIAAFALVALPASLWNLTRPPVYRAAAMVLTIVPAERSGAGAAEANLQHVAIQRRILLGRPLLQETLARLREDSAPTAAPRPTPAASGETHRDAATGAAALTPDDLLTMLAVDPVPETNLVELSATGGEPALLARLVNAWLGAYETLRAREIESQVGDRLAKLDARAQRLEARIQAKRDALDAFRERFDIVTLGRDSNEAMERLSALQKRLDDAETAAAEARAERARIEGAIANGLPVLPDRLANRLERLRQQAEQARARVLRLRERYTDYFIDLDLNKRRVVERAERIEQELAELERQGSQEALASAREAVAAADARVAELRRALSAQQARASRFSSGFAEFESLQEDLAQLETLQREVESERVTMETTVYADYPQIEIIDPAFAPRDPIHPDYQRDLLLTLLAATALGLLTVIVLTWLDASARRTRAATPVTGVRIWGRGEQRAPSETQETPLPRRTEAPTLNDEHHQDRNQARLRALGRDTPSAADQPAPPSETTEPSPRPLTVGEIAALWELAEADERQLIGLLLCGVQPDEARALTRAAFDLAAGRLRLGTAVDQVAAQQTEQTGRSRTLALPPRVLACFRDAEPLPAWAGRDANGFEDLIHRLSLLAADAGIAHADAIDAQTLHDTYVIHLVRQGARLTRLGQIAGPMSAAEVRRFAPFAPPGASRPFEELELTHPALAS